MAWDSEAKVAWTNTRYGRGQPYTANEVEVRVRTAYREARVNATGKIWFGADEDAYFAGDEAAYEPSPIELLEEVRDEEHALRVWWEMYGSGSAETESDMRELGFGPWIEKYGRGMMPGD